MLKKIAKLNFLLLFIIILIAVIGFFALYSAANGSFDPWAKKHIIRFSLTLILLIVISLIDIKILHKYAYIIFMLSFLLLVYVEIAGIFGLGAKRWILFFGISIQPSELIKVAIILALAKYYHDLKFSRIIFIRNIFIPLFIILVPFLLVLTQPDLGTSVMILLLGLSIMFLAGVRLWKFFIGFIISLISMPLVWNSLHPYQHKRLLSFLNPESDPFGTGYHLIQSKIALGSGGIGGKGYLKGTQSYLDFLPEKQTDFIFTLVGEEFGFIGAYFLIILFLLTIILSYYISFKSNHVFGKLLSVGVSINLFLYVFSNIAMVIGVIPVVGVPLPLISYGGTAMLAVMISFGLLMNVAVHRNFNR